MIGTIVADITYFSHWQLAACARYLSWHWARHVDVNTLEIFVRTLAPFFVRG